MHEHDATPPHHHRDFRGGGARAAVFGVSDGLVTNVSLVLGMAGANPGGSIVRLAGVAGLIAGSFSMAAGEYLSMTAQRELMERELEVERRSLESQPRGRGGRAARHVRPPGHRPGGGHRHGQRGHAGPRARARDPRPRGARDHATATSARPWQAAAASFVTFALGAFIPLAPWLFTSGTTAIVLSVVLGAVASLAVGVVLARYTERPVVVSALRQLAVTVVAAGVTFGVGKAIGTGVS